MSAMFKTKLVSTWIGLSAGNFAFQWLGDQHWMQAVERSMYQLIALATFGLVWWITEKRHG